MIKAIIFDLGGVLFTNGTKRFITYISQKYNLEQKFIEDVMDGELGTLYRENQMTKDEFWKRAIEKMNINADTEELNNYWIDGYELIEGTRDIILNLKGKYKIYYLSDNVKERVDKIDQKYHFLNWFDGGIFSYEVDIRKPDPKIYKLALKQIQVLPEEIVFIDDKEEAILPAKEMGMMAIHFQNPAELHQELKRIHIY